MVFTNTGIDAVSKIMGGSGAIPDYIGIGSGYTAAAGSNTALEYEIDRNQCSERNKDTGSQVIYISNFTSTETDGLTLWEVGLFNPGSAMFARNVVGSYAFTGDQELQVQYTVNFY